MSFTRKASYPGKFDAMVKAAKSLGFRQTEVTAHGTWRSLQPVNGDYVDIEGPFAVRRGLGPAFFRASDGMEIFMLDDTSHVSVVFSEES